MVNKKLRAEIEKLKAINAAELDSIHALGDEYERVLEENHRLKNEIDALHKVVEKQRAKIAVLSVQEAGCRLSIDMAKFVGEELESFTEKLKEKFRDATYIVPVRYKNLDRAEVSKRLTEMLQKDVLEVIDCVLKEVAGDKCDK